MKQIIDFLTEAKVFYFATIDGNTPKIRPFGFFMEHKGRLYFGMGTHKEVWKQVIANPQVEVCALKSAQDYEWIRIYGRAVPDQDPDTLTAAFEKAPFLKTIYNEQSGLTLGLIWIDQGKAEFMGKAGKTETLSF
ncbi:MAG: pyridoxamine 5'-phosphate oxidase family protein [Treponema sp.]|jgi:uncharacterized pyridoxamine 5'-phosphate oxidase family protein|nr:pyridoxamine 5'-phosphate oxidase family protein [Treponema sp.]